MIAPQYIPLLSFLAVAAYAGIIAGVIKGAQALNKEIDALSQFEKYLVKRERK